MEPENTVAFRGLELVDEKARPAEEDVRRSLHPLEGVIDVPRRREELVLTDVELFALLQMDCGDVTGAVATEGDLALARGFRHEDLDPRHHALHGPLHRLDAYGDAGVLPEKDVMLEVYGRAGGELDGERGNKLSVEMIGDASEGLSLGGCCSEHGTFHLRLH